VLVRSVPAAGTVVARRPASVTLEFGEPIEALAQIRVYNDRGLRVDRGATHTRGHRVSVALVRNLAAGTYVVHWRAVGVDGHPAADSLVFDYLRPTRAGVVREAPDHTTRARGVLRAIALLLLAVALGRALFARGAAVRAWSLAASAAVIALLAADSAGLSGLPVRRAVDPSVLRQVVHTTTGGARVVQMAAGLIAAVFPALLAVPALVVALGAEAVAGHAAVAPHPLIAEAIQAVHVVTMGVWLGGLTTLWRRADRTAERLSRWRRVALTAVVVLIATGTINSVIEIGSVTRLLHTRYGALLLVKVAVLAAVLVVAAVNHRGGARPRLVRFELPGVVVIVALAVALSALPAPRNGSGPVSRVFPFGPWRASFVVDPDRTGANEVHLFLLAGPDALATDVRTAQVVVAHGAVRSDVHLREEGQGHYVTETGALRVRGRWTARIHAERTDGSRYDAQIHFTVAP